MLKHFSGLLTDMILVLKIHLSRLICYGISFMKQAARNWLSLELTEEDPFIPYVSDEEDIDLKEGEFIRNISVNIRFYEGWDE